MMYDRYALSRALRSSLDAALSARYTYSYSMGIGDAWSVRYVLPADKRYTYSAETVGGTLYNYGLVPPRYPVPAIRTNVDLQCGILIEHGKWEWQDVGFGQAYTCANKIISLLPPRLVLYKGEPHYPVPALRLRHVWHWDLWSRYNVWRMCLVQYVNRQNKKLWTQRRWYSTECQTDVCHKKRRRD